MATTTRTRAALSGSPAAAKRARTQRTPLSARIANFGRSFHDTLPELAGTPRFRREMLAVVLVLLALLSAYVIGRGGDEGRFVSWWGTTLERSFGRAAFLVPVLLALAALRAFGGQPGRILEARHYLGGFAFSIAVVGLLQLGARPNAAGAGGALGMSVAGLAQRLLGPFGSGLALFAIGVLAIFLLAGSDLQTFSDDVAALIVVIWSALTSCGQRGRGPGGKAAAYCRFPQPPSGPAGVATAQQCAYDHDHDPGPPRAGAAPSAKAGDPAGDQRATAQGSI